MKQIGVKVPHVLFVKLGSDDWKLAVFHLVRQKPTLDGRCSEKLEGIQSEKAPESTDQVHLVSDYQYFIPQMCRF